MTTGTEFAWGYAEDEQTHRMSIDVREAGLIVLVGEGTVIRLMDHAPYNFGGIKEPVLRAVTIARLRAWADELERLGVISDGSRA